MYVLLIYLFLAAAVLFELMFPGRRSAKREWILYALIAGFFLIRFSLGQDTESYYWIFTHVTNPVQDAITSHMMRNITFTAFSFVIKLLFREYRWFVLCSNLLILGVCTWVTAKHSPYPLLSLMLFTGSGVLEVYYGSGLRQGMAMALFLFAYYRFLPKKQYLWYELFVLLAIGCQEAAVIALPVPLLMKLKGPFRNHPVRTALAMLGAGVLFVAVTYNGAVAVEHFFIDRYGFAPSWTHVLAYFHDREFSIVGIAMETVFVIGIMVLYLAGESEKDDAFLPFEMLTFICSVAAYYAMSMYPLMSRCSDLIQIIMLGLVPKLFFRLRTRPLKAAAWLGVVMLNGVLLFVDLREKCRHLTDEAGNPVTVEIYPYITVFDRERVEAALVFPE